MVFEKTGARPYTGEQIAAAFLTGLELKQVRSWFENERKKCLKDDEDAEVDFWPQDPQQDPTDSRLMVLHYNRDREGYARELVFGERDVRTGHPLGEWDPSLGRLARCRTADSLIGRVSLVRAWNRWERERRRDHADSEEHGDEQVAHE